MSLLSDYKKYNKSFKVNKMILHLLTGKLKYKDLNRALELQQNLKCLLNDDNDINLQILKKINVKVLFKSIEINNTYIRNKNEKINLASIITKLLPYLSGTYRTELLNFLKFNKTNNVGSIIEIITLLTRNK